MNRQIHDEQSTNTENMSSASGRFLRYVRDILISEKSPYIITIFFAALSWTIIRTVDELAGLPIIEYRTSPNEIGFSGNYHSQVAGIRLRNITRNVIFDCLIFSVQAYSENNRYRFIRPATRRYILSGTSVVTGDSEVANTYFFQITIKNFYPGADIEFGVETSGQGQLRPRVIECPHDDIAKGDHATSEKSGTKESPFPVFLKQSMQTKFVENELFFLWTGLFVWLVLMILILWLGRTSSSDAGVRTDHTGD
jgi:hypothetical protein